MDHHRKLQCLYNSSQCPDRTTSFGNHKQQHEPDLDSLDCCRQLRLIRLYDLSKRCRIRDFKQPKLHRNRIVSADYLQFSSRSHGRCGKFRTERGDKRNHAERSATATARFENVRALC